MTYHHSLTILTVYLEVQSLTVIYAFVKVDSKDHQIMHISFHALNPHKDLPYPTYTVIGMHQGSSTKLFLELKFDVSAHSRIHVYTV